MSNNMHTIPLDPPSKQELEQAAAATATSNATAVTVAAEPENEDPERGDVSDSAGPAHNHDQLPSVEEYKSQVSNAAAESGHDDVTRTCMFRMALAFLVLMIAGVLVAVGIVIGRDTEPSSSAGAPGGGSNPRPPVAAPPEDEPVDDFEDPDFILPGPQDEPAEPEPEPVGHSSRMQELIDLISLEGWSNPNDVNLRNSPQWKAALWMAEEDPMKMDLINVVELRERYALTVFYFSMDGDAWPQKLNWLSSKQTCEWHDGSFLDNNQQKVVIGADCGTGNMVKKIRMDGLQIEGELPREIVLLATLEELDLRGNKIGGGFPKEMVRLQSLQSIKMKDNRLIGGIPEWMGDLFSLTELDLSHNHFVGHIPRSFTKLNLLVTLNLSKNKLTGNITDLHGLERVEALLLGDNKLSGPLDEVTFSSWKNIKALDMSDNALTGQLPKTFFEIPNLSIVDLHGNQFSGELPDLTTSDSDIVYLALQNNNFSGANVGKSLQLMQQLEHLDLSYNHFVGPMPTELGLLTNLRYLFLSFNEQFEYGVIPTEYGKLTKLVDFSLQATNRVKAIPTEIGQLKDLVLLDLNNNTLTGSLPDEIGNLKNLRFMLVKDNELSGPLPSALGQLEALHVLIMNNNFFEGTAAPVCQRNLATSKNMTEFVADCPAGGGFTCSCCTSCCRSKTSPVCTTQIWYSGLDPVYDPIHLFQRQYYIFHQESNTRYPAVDDGDFRL